MRVSIRVRAVAVMATAALLAVALVPPFSGASSHREAPMISQDPAADGTDFYMFKSPDRTDSITLIANYYPFQEPAGGPNFYRFGDDVLYRISIDDNGDAIPDQWFDFRFATTVRNGNTFLYNTGPVASLLDPNLSVNPNLNVYQTFTVTRTYSNGGSSNICSGIVPPNNIGPMSTPNYAALAQSAVVNNCSDGIKAFAGQRDDPFYVDLGATFDLLTIRPGPPGNKGGGKDDLSGYNLLSIALQVPISKLTNDGSTPTDPNAQFAVIGGWTTSYRQKVRVLKGDGVVGNDGPWVQVSRLGAPLVNEVVVPLGAKDLWNSSEPSGDGQFLGGVTDPEAARLLHAIYSIDVPPTPRNDLVAIFLTGITGLNKPAFVKPSEELRLNVATPVTASPNRMGVLGGDNQGFPNGRRLGDDVIDIALQAVAGGTPFTPAQNKAPNNQLGDGVNVNDIAFLTAFPYVGLPTSGFDHTFPGHRIEPLVP